MFVDKREELDFVRKFLSCSIFASPGFLVPGNVYE